MTSQARVRYDTQDDFATEPVRGLPEMLPAGEKMIWQGSPAWSGLATSAYHARAAAGYFAVLLAWRALSGILAGEAASSIAISLIVFAALAVAAVGTLVLLGYLAAQTTVYTITSQRLVMRIGIALPMTLNLPFKAIIAASARVHTDGTADIPVQLAPAHRLAFLILWPHCRPWHMRRPEPMLRRVPDGARIAELLAQVLRTYTLADAAKAAATDHIETVALPRPAAEPVRSTVAATVAA